ncbi:MarR family transcriptional regulator [Streptomyces sp. HJ7]
MTELAERLGVVPRAVTPLIDALEEAGLVRRLAEPDNRRSSWSKHTDVPRPQGTGRGTSVGTVRPRPRLQMILSGGSWLGDTSP